jgi:oligopeptide/dipeptide ABC transporter ATP-binding protein
MKDIVLDIDNLVVGLGKKPGGERIIDGISLQVREGETLCVVGESGSGKSVTSLTVMGLLQKGALVPMSGSVKLVGEELLAASDRRLRQLRATRMAMIFQEPMTALNPVVPVGRQIDEVLRVHTDLDARARRQKILAMMEHVRLPDVERIFSSYPHRLSGGQRQRIMIAMALVLEPKLLIADEPTTALDVTTQKQILTLIRDLQRDHGTAVLFITHDMGVVAEIADRVAVMRNGRLVETGTLDTILRTPTMEYTRNLLSAVPSLVPRAPRVDSTEPVVLEANELGKVYRERSFFGKAREVAAAQGVTLTLRKGRTLGIVGESGSGKSTVARCIVRLIDPTSGGIRLAGREISELSRRLLQPHRKRIQIIFQDPYRSLNPRVTIGETIAEGPINYGMPHAEALAKARELLELVDLPADAISRYPHQFSGGQRQRVMIAMALACTPKLLIADEPTTALDVTIQAQILELIGELQGRLGMAVLLITHDLGVVAERADEVAVMYAGKIVESAKPEVIFSRPKHPYTIGLLDSLPGRRGGKKRLAAIPGMVPSPLDWPTGCRFRDRCARADASCAAQPPPLIEIERHHRVACFMAT